jgi:hypothetical protein
MMVGRKPCVYSTHAPHIVHIGLTCCLFTMSIGGGLSIITGAQAQIPAVGLSGPNTMLTRLSLRPQVEANDLDKYTFNIVPERDVVPMLDDKAQNYQFIRCTAGYTDIVGCHDSTRYATITVDCVAKKELHLHEFSPNICPDCCFLCRQQ